MKVEFRYGMLASGKQCVMIPGVLLMQMLHAGNLGTTRQHKPIRELILAKDQVTSYWMIWNAMELKNLSSSVRIVVSSATTVGMVKMQVWHVSQNVHEHDLARLLCT